MNISKGANILNTNKIMKTLFNCGNYGNELEITRQDAIFCSGSGDMELNCRQTMQKTYIKKQLKTLNPENLAKELKEYGAWMKTSYKTMNKICFAGFGFHVVIYLKI